MPENPHYIGTVHMDPLFSPPSLPHRTGTMCILLFQVSFSADLNYIACVEVSYKKAAMSGGDSEDEELAEPEVDTLPEKIPM